MNFTNSNLSFLLVSGLLAYSVAIAADPASFKAKKELDAASIQERLQLVQEHLGCVQAATDHAALKACHDTAKTIAFDTNAAAKHNLFNISVLEDGSLVLAHPLANEISTISNENQPNQHNHGPLKQLHSFAIAVTEDGDSEEHDKSGVLDFFISSAHATKHKLRGHEYINLTITNQGSVVCYRYDVTLNMKYVGACI